MKRTIGQKIADTTVGKDYEDYLNNLSDKSYDNLLLKLTISNAIAMTVFTGLIYLVGYLSNNIN
jgi:hypothetical protein